MPDGALDPELLEGAFRQIAPARRIDELLRVNEMYRQRAINAEDALRAAEARTDFWQRECERHAHDKAILEEEVARLRRKLTGAHA